jgi:hypothetical protein
MRGDYWLRLGFVCGLLVALLVGVAATTYRVVAHRALAQHDTNVWVEAHGTTGAIASWEQALTLDPSNEETYHLLAQAHAVNGDEAKVLEIWRRATTANQHALWPWRAMADAARDFGSYEVAAQALSEAVAVAPNDMQLMEELAHIRSVLVSQEQAKAYWNAIVEEPSMASFVPVDQADSSEWTLVGYFADGDALVGGGATPLWLVWQATDTHIVPGTAEAGWGRIEGSLWMQTAGEVLNLIGDGSFERRGPDSSAIAFPNDLYGADPATRQVRAARRDGQETHTAVLANGLANPDVSFVSQPIAVAADKSYLQSGRVRSVNGNAFLGRRWLADGGMAQEEYLVTGDTGGTWGRYMQLAAPPAAATALEVLLLNLNTTGTAYFDDILLLPIDRPQSQPQ